MNEKKSNKDKLLELLKKTPLDKEEKKFYEEAVKGLSKDDAKKIYETFYRALTTDPEALEEVIKELQEEEKQIKETKKIYEKAIEETQKEKFKKGGER